jgi:hypothetical protein
MRTSLRRAAAAAAITALLAGCAAGPRPASSHQLLTVSQRRELAARYLAIATAGNEHLERDFDALEGRDRGNLVAARADLADAAATEHRFDQRLLAIRFPARIESVARLLAYLNEARSQLTRKAAASRTLQQLRRQEPVLQAANAPVEEQVRAIRSQLGLPPPSAS